MLRGSWLCSPGSGAVAWLGGRGVADGARGAGSGPQVVAGRLDGCSDVDAVHGCRGGDGDGAGGDVDADVDHTRHLSDLPGDGVVAALAGHAVDVERRGTDEGAGRVVEHEVSQGWGWS